MSSAVPQSPLRCHRTFAPAREPSQIFTKQTAAPTLPGEPCIGNRCACFVTVRDAEGKLLPLGCADAVTAGVLAGNAPVLIQILAAWHNDRIAATPGAGVTPAQS